MTTVDVVILLLGVAAAAGGFRLGLLARAGSWMGVLVGLAVSTRVVEPVVGWFDRTDEFTRLLVAIMVVGGLALVGQAIGFSLGARLRFRLASGRLRWADSVGGAAAGILSVLLVVWLLLPTLGLVPGALARAARNSAVVGFVDDVAPQPPAALRDLSQRVSDFDFPQVFVDMTPAPDTGPPPEQLPVPASVVDLVSPSTVNVEARGCGGVQEGSGFVVEQGVVATNAHVVAGATSIELLLTDGSTRQATVVLFDDDRDLALLAVADLGRPPLTLQDAEVGEGAAVFGHPAGQDQLRVASARVTEQIDAVGRDIYGRDRVRREVLVMASDLERGDSGAAVVDAQANAVGIAFAVAPDRSDTAYALSAGELRAVLGAPRAEQMPAGRCL